jgi:hypothetical protein
LSLLDVADEHDEDVIRTHASLVALVEFGSFKQVLQHEQGLLQQRLECEAVLHVGSRKHPRIVQSSSIDGQVEFYQEGNAHLLLVGGELELRNWVFGGDEGVDDQLDDWDLSGEDGCAVGGPAKQAEIPRQLAQEILVDLHAREGSE